MIRMLCVLSCGVIVAGCGIESVSNTRAENCACCESELPTAEEVYAKVEALSARDIALIERTQAEERKAQIEAGAAVPKSRISDTIATDSVVAESPSRYRVIVSFDAADAAPQSETSQKLDELVAALERRSGHGIERRSLPGHAGGYSVCLPLTELNDKQQQAFVSDLRSTLVPLGHVHIDEHVLCGRQLQPVAR